MATVSIDIYVPQEIYSSLQIGDILFYATPNADVAGFKNADENNITKIGELTLKTSVTVDGTKYTRLRCNMDDSTPPPTTSDFIFFSKDNKVNLTSLAGYYASVKFKNNSKEKAEMFSAAFEINESSK